ncbi:MAG: hypothetical protein HY681_11950 [Chloroflexi bacterium]|nr:hypothetical protein [Chloroflexota bacterium]
MRDTAVAVRSSADGEQSILVLTLDISRHDDLWVGACLELGTAAYAPTLEELRDELQEAVLLQLNEVERLGFIDQYLQEHSVAVAQLPQARHAQERWGFMAVGV